MEKWIPVSPTLLGVMLIGLLSGWLSSQAHERLRARRDVSKSSRQNWLLLIYLLPLVGPLLYLRKHKQWLALREAAYTLD